MPVLPQSMAASSTRATPRAEWGGWFIDFQDKNGVSRRPAMGNSYYFNSERTDANKEAPTALPQGKRFAGARFAGTRFASVIRVLGADWHLARSLARSLAQ
ncbi:hypothetical protein MASR1M59_05450 [Melaminivora sp.]